MLSYNPGAQTSVFNNWIKEDGKWIPACFSNKEIDGIKALKKIYDEGCLDRDFAIIKGEEGSDKFVSGRAGAICFVGYNAGAPDMVGKFKKNFPDLKFEECVKLMSFWPAADGKRYHPTMTNYWSESYFNAKMDDGKMDRVMRLYDFFLSDKGLEMANYGLEGVDYSKDGDKITITREKDEDGNYVALDTKYPSVGTLTYLPSWHQDYGVLDDPSIPEGVRNMVRDFQAYLESNTAGIDTNFAVSLMSTTAKDKLAFTIADDITKIILSKEDPEKLWKQTVDSYNAKGLKDAIDEVNAKVAELGIN
jgi:hypothetical protein